MFRRLQVSNATIALRRARSVSADSQPETVPVVALRSASPDTQPEAVALSSTSPNSEPDAASVVVGAPEATRTVPTSIPHSRRQPKTKSVAAALKESLFCEICVSEPRRKKEVAIKRCGHSMCLQCAAALRKVRNRKCPTCRASVSIPNDLQLLVPCKESDLC
jgi:hypothetical protein